MSSIAEILAYHRGQEASRAARSEKKPSAAVKKPFYASQKWRRLRYAALRKNREKHGQITCEVCNEYTGPWHVDHIEPVSKNWARRLDPENVQIMCERCNLGKSNTDRIDWRRE